MIKIIQFFILLLLFYVELVEVLYSKFKIQLNYINM